MAQNQRLTQVDADAQHSRFIHNRADILRQQRGETVQQLHPQLQTARNYRAAALHRNQRVILIGNNIAGALEADHGFHLTAHLAQHIL